MALTTLNIKEPGLNVLPPGVERYVVEGGGLTGIQILPDDVIEIINNEGNQICEVSVFNKDGKSELAILSLKEIRDNSEIKKILLKKKRSLLISLQRKDPFLFWACLVQEHHSLNRLFQVTQKFMVLGS